MDAFVARQPIFDKNQKAWAYELLFRTSYENRYPVGTDPTKAATKCIEDSLDIFGLKALGSGKRVFVNITRQVLVEEHVHLISPQSAVIEILETVTPDPEVIKAVSRLKEEGYTIALDDFIFSPGYEPLVELADIIKVDFLATKGEDRKRVVERFGRGGKVKFLAEKVENQQEVEDAQKAGYELFQGYFYCKPQVLAAKSVPAFKVNYLRLMQELNRAEFDIPKIENIIKQEMSLTVKLLRYLNSAAFGWRSKVTSIRQALVMLGERPFRKWATLVAVTTFGSDKPDELVRVSLVRGRMCELLGKGGSKIPDLDLFLTGLLSSVDALLDRPMPEILESLAVSPLVRAALLENKGELAIVRALMHAFEQGKWDLVNGYSKQLGLLEGRLAEAFREAVTWADNVLAADITPG